MDIFTGLIKVVQDEGLKSASMRFDNWQESLEEMAESANQEELAAIHVLRASLHRFEGKRNLFEEMPPVGVFSVTERHTFSLNSLELL